MTRTSTLGATVAMAALMAAPLPAQTGYPTRPPAPTSLRPVMFPGFVTHRLGNGLDLLVVEHREQPVVTISLTFPAGGAYAPADRTGLAGLVAELLTKGTERRTADEMAAEIEGAGGSIGASAGNDFLTITVSALSENLRQALDLLADAVRNSNFRESEVDLARTRALSGLQASLAQPEVIADRIFSREVYGDHPYGRVETAASLRAITRDDVLRFYRERVLPSGALLVVAGNVNSAAVRGMATEALGSWRGTPGAAPAAPAPPTRTSTEIVLVHKPGAVQSNIIAGFTFIRPTDPSLYALTLMNRVLGGGADARLFMILREEKGWTYGAYSSFSRPRGIGAFQATAEVRTAVTDSALAELLRQLDRIRADAPADSEVTAAKNYLVGRFPLTIETPEQIAGAVANARLLGLPADYVQRYRERLSAVTTPQIHAAARRHLATDRMVIVVVGDGPRILNGLKALGRVRIVDTEGRPLTEADVAPPTAAAAVAFEAARIVPHELRYRILVQGNPFGEETRTVRRASEGGREVWVSVTNTVLGPIGRQLDTTIVETAALRPVRVRLGATMQGQEIFVRLDYAGGRVRGQTRTPQAPGAPRDATIDTTVTANTLDEYQLGLVLLALPYARGARWTLPVFAGSDGMLKSYTVSVEGEESVTTPAGTFPCWRVSVTGGQLPMTFFVTREGPGAIVKAEAVGMPLVWELTTRN